MNEIIEALVKDILEYNPVEGDFLKAAQLGSYEINGLACSKDSNTVLISPSLIPRIKPAHINLPVKSSEKDYSKDFIYKPSFSIYLSPSSGLSKVEPLIVSWGSGNHTVFTPDQGFLQTYKLIPRITQDIIYWDDRSKPIYGVVENRSNSFYKFPNYSDAYVKINQEYFRDYISLRKKAAVYIFQEKRNIEINEDIYKLLGEEGYFILETNQYEIRLKKYPGKEIAQLEVNGFKILCDPSYTEKPDVEGPSIGHKWKGIDKLITGYRDAYSKSFQYVYVSDDVLAKYEGDEDYEIYPEHGSVHYNFQWSVSNCNRIGRNVIQIDIKKLYEGTPYDVIDYWNKFSIEPSAIDKKENNIALRSIELIRMYLLFGRLLSAVINKYTNLETLPSQIISFEEEELSRESILQNSIIQPIAYHVSYKSFTKEDFISRCKKLHIVLVEHLGERVLRKCVDQFGFDTEKTKQYRSIKLLDLVLAFVAKTEESGLNPINDRQVIIERLEENSTSNLVNDLLSLNNLRQLDAHKSSDFKVKFSSALRNFDIHSNSNSITNNYSSSCDKIYDRLISCFSNLNHFLIGIDYSEEKEYIDK